MPSFKFNSTSKYIDMCVHLCVCSSVCYLKTSALKSVSTDGDRSPLQGDNTNIVAFNENQNCKTYSKTG